jgi:DNA polymerase-3 subunit delta'
MLCMMSSIVGVHGLRVRGSRGIIEPMTRILGQDRALRTLRASLELDRVHHAWIFHGPAGVGKHTAAVAFAHALLDPDARLESDGVVHDQPGTEVATLLRSGTHPDLRLINKELALYSDDPNVRNRKLITIPIDVIRDHLIAPAYRASTVAPRSGQRAAKVFIVDEAELLNDTSQNALLKTLEEPPPGTIIVLVTTKVERLLPTVRSRCQRVAFATLGEDELRAWMRDALPDVAPDEAAWIARFADGSPGRAQLAADSGFYQWAIEFEPMIRSLEAGRLPTSMGRQLAQRVGDFAEQWVAAHDNASKDAANKLGANLMFTLLAHSACDRLRDLARAGHDPEPWAGVVDAVRDAERKLHANVHPGMVFDHLVITWRRALAAHPTA